MKSKVYQKGQIIIPVDIRKKYGIEIGSTVEVIPEKKHLKIVLVKKKEPVSDIAGCFKSNKHFPTKKVIKKAVIEGYTKNL